MPDTMTKIEIPTPTAKVLAEMLGTYVVAMEVPAPVLHGNCPACKALHKSLQPTEPITIRPEAKRAWCEALRSGRWRQIFNQYREGNGRCAVAVLLEVAELREFDDVNLPEYLGVSEQEANGVVMRVIRWNDEDRMSFSAIADRIEREF